MAEVKSVMEREYVIPLRSAWRKAANYKRARKAIMEIKSFIARHMKVAERDLDKVKLDVYLSNEVWFRGSRKPPVRIKVKAIKEGELVRVELADVPDVIKFNKAKQEKMNKASEKKVETKAEEKKETKTEEKKEKKTEEQVKEEKEKEKSVALLREKQADMDAKALKHTVKTEVKMDTQQKKSLSR